MAWIIKANNAMISIVSMASPPLTFINSNKGQAVTRFYDTSSLLYNNRAAPASLPALFSAWKEADPGTQQNAEHRQNARKHP